MLRNRSACISVGIRIGLKGLDPDPKLYVIKCRLERKKDSTIFSQEMITEIC